MAIADIHKWLQDPDRKFRDGQNLFDAHNPNPGSAVTVLIKSSENSFSRQKLMEQLRAIAESDVPKPKFKKAPPNNEQGATEEPRPTADPSFEKKKRHKLGETSGYPPHLIELDKQTLLDLKDLEALVRESPEIPEGEDLRISATKRVLLDRKIAKAYSELHYFAQNGTVMPGTEPETDLQRAARLMDALVNNRPNISKYKKKNDPESVAKVKAWEAELEEANAFRKKHRR